MIGTLSRLGKALEKRMICRMIAEHEGRIAFNIKQINHDKAKLAEYNSKPSLNFLQSRDMTEREGRILFNERLLEQDKASLEILKEKLRKLQ